MLFDSHEQILCAAVANFYGVSVNILCSLLDRGKRLSIDLRNVFPVFVLMFC